MKKVIELRIADTTKPAKPELEAILPFFKSNTGLVFVQNSEEGVSIVN